MARHSGDKAIERTALMSTVSALFVLAARLGAGLTARLAAAASARYFARMTRLEKLEREIEALPPQEMQALAAWFEELRERQWDEQMERDAVSGKLDKLADAAMADMAAGRIKPLFRQ